MLNSILFKDDLFDFFEETYDNKNFRCMTKASLGFTWSAAVIAIVLGAISMLLVCFSAIKMRENDFETFETQRVR